MLGTQPTGRANARPMINSAIPIIVLDVATGFAKRSTPSTELGVAPISLTDLRKGTNTLVHLTSRRAPQGNSTCHLRPAIKASHSNELLAGHFTPFAEPIGRPPRP